MMPAATQRIKANGEERLPAPLLLLLGTEPLVG
jgi:hypothetical protein